MDDTTVVGAATMTETLFAFQYTRCVTASGSSTCYGKSDHTSANNCDVGRFAGFRHSYSWIVSRATDPSYFLIVFDELSEKIRSKSIRAGVIGLGYVGLPLAVEFAKTGVETVGFDVDREKIDSILRGESYISDVDSEAVSSMVSDGTLVATTDFSLLAAVDTINICVPTPLRKTKDPDLSYIIKAVEQIAAYLRPGQVVILESTTYPGTVTEVVQPRLEKKGLRAGTDFFLKCWLPTKMYRNN